MSTRETSCLQPSFLQLLPFVMILYILPTTFAGLSIDQHVDFYEAEAGDDCNYYAFLAFRLPILEIIVRTYGNYGEQNIQIENYESFTYTNANNITSHYDYVPNEFMDNICRSRIDPLMCELEEPETGMGVCVCLNINVKDDKGNDIVVRTSAVTTSSLVKRKDLISTGNTDGEDSTNDTESTTIGETTTTTSTTTPDPEELLPIDTTKCYAKFGTFCGSPYINCKPYMNKRGKMTTDCFLATCGTAGSFNLVTLPLIFTLIMYQFL